MKLLLEIKTERPAADIMSLLDRWTYAQGLRLDSKLVPEKDENPTKDVYLLLLYGQAIIAPQNLTKAMIVDRENFEDVVYMRPRMTRFESLRQCQYLAQSTDEASMRRHCEKMNWNIVDMYQTNGY